MKNIHVDLDLLLELSLQETRGEGDCYLSLDNGEFNYIPQGIIEALEDESKFQELESWEKELANDATHILMNYEDKYIPVPLIEEDVITSAMKSYIDTLEGTVKEEVSEKIDWDNPFLSFNKTMIDHDLSDSYYEYRDSFLKKHLITWLSSNNVKAI